MVEETASSEESVRSADSVNNNFVINNANNAAEELTEKGSAFLIDKEFAEAVDCFSRSLEIRVAHYGELDIECVNAYYLYGFALFHKALAESDALGSLIKKVQAQAGAYPLGSCGKDQGGDGDEDDSDLDMAWKMLEIARSIADKHSNDDTMAMAKVDILIALAEVSLEREDIESSLGDYKEALSILESQAELDSLELSKLYFCISDCLIIGQRPKEAMRYCKKAKKFCNARLKGLTDELEDAEITEDSVLEIYADLKNIKNMLKDLKQQLKNPKNILDALMDTVEMSSSCMGTANTSLGKDIESPTGPTAHTGAAAAGGGASSGVAGRGVKRVLMNASSSASKKPATEFSDRADDGNSS